MSLPRVLSRYAHGLLGNELQYRGKEDGSWW
jgi:hypothetical protein